ncbi:MAG: hypothetical protein ACYTGC_09810 [Planctomycetota bacterium]|jgi:hypothetical protein
MRAHRLVTTLLAVSAMQLGCQDTGTSDAMPPAAPAAEAPAATLPATSDEPAVQVITSNGGRYRVQFSPRPEDIPSNELFSMAVHVLEADGTPLPPGAVQLEVDARMPAHRHGMNTMPEVRRADDGSFVVDGMMLHMSGDWVLYFDITQDGTTERAETSMVLD